MRANIYKVPRRRKLVKFGPKEEKKIKLRTLLSFLVFGVLLLHQLHPGSLFFKISMAVALLVGFVLVYTEWVKRPPLKKWYRGTMLMFFGALIWMIVPMILYLCGEADTFMSAFVASVSSVVMWLMAAYCWYRVKQVKQRSAQQIMQMRFEEGRRKEF